jgi:hypothetical protein
VETIDGKTRFLRPLIKILFDGIVFEDGVFGAKNEGMVGDDKIGMKFKGFGINLVIVIKTKENRVDFARKLSAHETAEIAFFP